MEYSKKFCCGYSAKWGLSYKKDYKDQGGFFKRIILMTLNAFFLSSMVFCLLLPLLSF